MEEELAFVSLGEDPTVRDSIYRHSSHFYGGLVVSALASQFASQANVGVQFPVVARVVFFPQVFFYLTIPTLVWRDFLLS